MSKKIITNNQTQDPRFRDVSNSWENLDVPSREMIYKAVYGDRQRKNLPNQWHVVITYALNPNNKKIIAGLFITSLCIAPFTKNLVEYNYLMIISILLLLNIICLILLNLLNATDQIRGELVYSALGLVLIVASMEIAIRFIIKAPPFLMVLFKTIYLNIGLIVLAILCIYIIAQLRKLIPS
ncbi:MAG: hypothetical protein MUO77_09840 [Anaerolineales bacterium]|nr:hypothetical protein [Anaerolineales bacterium]